MAINPAHPLIRDGKSQTERLKLQALAPELVKLDDRSERQLLVYLNEFAKSIAYYDTDETDDHQVRQSNWQNFFRSGSSVQAALIEAFDVRDYENKFDQTQQNFLEGLERADYMPLFDFLFESALMVNRWYIALSSDVVLLDNKVILNETPLRRTIGDLVASNLSPTLGQLIAIANLFVKTQSDDGYHFPDLSDLMADNAPLWGLTPVVQATRDTVLSSLSPQSPEFERQARERLNDVFHTFAKVIRQIVTAAAQQDIVQSTRTHEPHLALLYTFLRLFQHVVSDLNRLTEKHLTFYYQEVLGLKPKPLTPDAAHIVFELPKGTPQYKLDAKTLLKHGKDAKGVEVKFALDNEIVITQTQIAELRTLYNKDSSFGARPKANSLDGLGKEFPDPKKNQWLTLGASGEGDTKAKVGLAIASSALILEKGQRIVTVTIACDNAPTGVTKSHFSIQLSGQKKWIPLDDKSIDCSVTTENQLIIKFTLQVKDDAVVAADPSILNVDYGVDGAAVLQILLVQNDGVYNIWRKLNIKSVGIVVEVSQLQNVKVRTDEGDMDPTKPFMPFGAVPSVGATFCIGSPEIFSKDLEEITVKYDWDKKPDDLQKYYEGYERNDTLPLPIDNNSFRRKLFFFKKGQFINKKEAGVFSQETKPGSSESFNIIVSDFAKAKPDDSPSVPNDSPSVSAAKDADWQTGFIAVQLQNDFLHTFYANSLTRRALFLSKPENLDIYFTSKTEIDTAKKNIENLKFTIPDYQKQGIAVVNDVKSKSVNEVEKLNTKLSTNSVIVKLDVDAVENTISNLPVTMPDFEAGAEAIVNDIKAKSAAEVEWLKTGLQTNTVINPPYTPVIKNLTIGYKTKSVDAVLFHIMPFDAGKNFAKIEPSTNQPKPLIYNFQERGALLIGLTDTVEKSLVPILFQLMESSADTTKPPAAINWAYLDGNDWKNLEKGKYILNDATEGFIKTGIIDLILPTRKSTLTTTILPPQYYWLKATTSGDTAAICQAIGVHTQAVRATFQPSEANDGARLAQPLSANSVAKLDVSDPNIKKVNQFYDTFGGLTNEDKPHFYRRVSERLRHKGRAVTLFDYEQLVLEAFPEVFKVKCIPHTFSDIQSTGIQATKDIHFAPSYVTVVVVPNAQTTPLIDPLLPTASRALLKRIEDYLKPRVSPFVHLKVLNPIYETILISCNVKFLEGRSPEYYAEVLKEDIKRFLAPWAFDPTAQVIFGGVVYRSSIVGFIEGRSYVDFVTDLEMRKTSATENETDPLVASAARVVLTSGEHTINLYDEKKDTRITVPSLSQNQVIGFRNTEKTTYKHFTT